MGYTYLAISVAALTVLAVSYKLSDRCECCQAQVNFFMFFSAAVGVISWGCATRTLLVSPAAAGLGVILGTMAFFSVRAFRESIAKRKLSTSWTILQLSLVIPVLASILFWREHPDLKRCLGLALTAAAILLLGVDMARSER